MSPRLIQIGEIVCASAAKPAVLRQGLVELSPLLDPSMLGNRRAGEKPDQSTRRCRPGPACAMVTARYRLGIGDTGFADIETLLVARACPTFELTARHV